MRELDSLLLAFMDRSAATFTAVEIATFEAFLELPDPTVHAYLLGRSAPADAVTAALVERIRASVGSQP
jgi:succinate dehydrogenase flavin-adding protein (antitoxin of CptAB toxin-antitoxin module)